MSIITEWFIGDGGYFLQNVNPCEYPMWFYQFTFAATTVAIVSGGMAGRTQFTAYVSFTAFLLSWVYPTIVHWTWSSTPWLAHGSTGDGNAGIGYAKLTPRHKIVIQSSLMSLTSTVCFHVEYS